MPSDIIPVLRAGANSKARAVPAVTSLEDGGSTTLTPSQLFVIYGRSDGATVTVPEPEEDGISLVIVADVVALPFQVSGDSPGAMVEGGVALDAITVAPGEVLSLISYTGKWFVKNRGGGVFPFRIITDSDTLPIALSQTELFVKYERTDGEAVEVWMPEATQNGLVLTVTNGPDSSFDLSGTGLFFDGNDGVVDFISIDNNETVTFVSYGGLWIVRSRYSGPAAVGPGNFTSLTVTNSLALGDASAVFTDFLFGNANLDFGSIAAGASADLTITVTGATGNSVVVLGLPASYDSGIVFNGFVSASDVVTVRASNISASPIDMGVLSFNAVVLLLQS